MFIEIWRYGSIILRSSLVRNWTGLLISSSTLKDIKWIQFMKKKSRKIKKGELSKGKWKEWKQGKVIAHVLLAYSLKINKFIVKCFIKKSLSIWTRNPCSYCLATGRWIQTYLLWFNLRKKIMPSSSVNLNLVNMYSHTFLEKDLYDVANHLLFD